MKSVAILLNSEKKSAVKLARELVPWFERHDVLIMAEAEAANAMGAKRLLRDEPTLTKADFALVMGGDGTLLRASRLMSPAQVPMLSLQYGQFGFMTDVSPKDVFPALERVISGDFRIDERMMLGCHVVRGRKRIPTADALNDIVITKGPLARMLQLGIGISGKYVSTCSADGLIIATPTGSTAYSLSAGGPLVAPELRVIILTPICPHTLSARPLVLSHSQVVEVGVVGGPGDVVMLTVDGQIGIPLEPGDTVVTRESKTKARLISFAEGTFFDKLQTRLRWGDRPECLESYE